MICQDNMRYDQVLEALAEKNKNVCIPALMTHSKKIQQITRIKIERLHLHHYSAIASHFDIPILAVLGVLFPLMPM